MFIGRQEELGILGALLEKKSSSAMVYGKRKVGKTDIRKGHRCNKGFGHCKTCER